MVQKWFPNVSVFKIIFDVLTWWYIYSKSPVVVRDFGEKSVAITQIVFEIDIFKNSKRTSLCSGWGVCIEKNSSGAKELTNH